MTISRDCLLVFTRYPQPGQAKTRLIPALGAVGAAELQRQMTEHTLTQVKLLQAEQPCLVEIWFASGAAANLAGLLPDDSTPDRYLPDHDLLAHDLPAHDLPDPSSPPSDLQLMQAWLGPETDQWVYHPQPSGDLGKRLSQACQTAFAAGLNSVVTIGTDCPGLDRARLQRAFQLLQQVDLVLGPATDGGYYLIGLRRFVPELFESIRWSSEVVLQQTVAIAESLNLTIAYLDCLTDVDRPEDLAAWKAVQAEPTADAPFVAPLTNPEWSSSSLESDSSQSEQSAGTQFRRPWLSVILPVLNEAGSIQATVQALRKAAQGEPIEILGVDGGSRDDTVLQLRAMGIPLLETAAGRSIQMNAGAKAAQGEVLLFLHADTRLPDGFVALVQQTLAQPQTVAGAFDLKISGSEMQSGSGLRWVERGVWLRSRLLQMPYGDQGIFLRADTFWALGGFAELPIMEDFELVQRLKRRGRIAMAPAAVVTSGRRWQQLGVIRTTLINQLVILAYSLGLSPTQIASWYRSGLRSSRGAVAQTRRKLPLKPKRARAEPNSDSFD
jgi:uncharacterized protein